MIHMRFAYRISEWMLRTLCDTDRIADRSQSMAIRDWPETERPREKLLAHGAQRLSDAELLAVLFGSGCRGAQRGGSWAASCCAEFGSLRAPAAGRPRPLQQHPGPGCRGATGCCRRRWSCRGGTIGRKLAAGPALESPQATQAFLVAQLRDRPYEVFCCLHLDNRHRLIAFDELFRGTIDGASVHPREVVRQALARNAAAVILAHNHPSGVAEPSQADELITQRLRDALGLVDIRVLDHLIVGDTRCVSFAERGLI